MNKDEKLKKYFIPMLLSGFLGMLPLSIFFTTRAMTGTSTYLEAALIISAIWIAGLLGFVIFWLEKIEKHLLKIRTDTVRDE